MLTLAWAATAARRAVWRAALELILAPAKLLELEAWAAARKATRGATCREPAHGTGGKDKTTGLPCFARPCCPTDDIRCTTSVTFTEVEALATVATARVADA